MRSSLFGSRIVVVSALVAACSSSIADQPAEAAAAPPEQPLHIAKATYPLNIPDSVRTEHEQIHTALIDATKVPGPVGDAARELSRVLHPHFVREEQIALPPLGLLAPLAAGDFNPEMQSVLSLTDTLRNELPRMLQEHVEIAAAARRLQQV